MKDLLLSLLLILLSNQYFIAQDNLSIDKAKDSIITRFNVEDGTHQFRYEKLIVPDLVARSIKF